MMLSAVDDFAQFCWLASIGREAGLPVPCRNVCPVTTKSTWQLSSCDARAVVVGLGQLRLLPAASGPALPLPALVEPLNAIQSWGSFSRLTAVLLLIRLQKLSCLSLQRMCDANANKPG